WRAALRRLHPCPTRRSSDLLRNAIIVVTRYFGGTLLGAAGLVRAYTQGARAAVEACGVVRQLLHSRIQVVLDYEWLGKVQHWLQDRKSTRLNSSHVKSSYAV